MSVRDLAQRIHERAHAILLAVEVEGSMGAEMKINPPLDRVVFGGQVVVAISEQSIDPKVLL